MDLQLFLAVNAMAVSAMAAGMTLIYRPTGSYGWVLVNALVVAVGFAAFWLAPDAVGWLVAAVFVPFVVAPVVLARMAQQQSVMGRQDGAVGYARWAAWLHPSEANRINAALVAAAAQSSETETRALEDLAARVPPQYRPVILVQAAATRRDWADVLAQADLAADAPGIIKPLEIRALGETGRRDAMVRAYMRARDLLGGAGFAVTRMTVLAFGGRPDGVHALLDGPLRKMDEDVKQFWLALGYLYSRGNQAPGQRMLATIAATAAKDVTRRAAQRHLDSVAANRPEPLSATANAELDILESRTIQTLISKGSPALTAPLTVTLIVLNLLAFAAEVYSGGSQDSDTLIALGALWPPDVLEQGQWWRLLSACFLHFGPIHLATNMFVLWVLGRLLEPILGLPRMLVIYLVGGLASSAFVLWLMTIGDTGYGLLVGASGAIFALLGAEAALVLTSWLHDRASFDSRKLSSLAMMLTLQVVIDLSVPNISFAAHVSGFVTGLAVMLAWPYVAALLPTVRSPFSGPRA